MNLKFCNTKKIQCIFNKLQTNFSHLLIGQNVLYFCAHHMFYWVSLYVTFSLRRMGVKGNSDNDYATALNMTCDFIGVPLIGTPSQKKFPSLNYDCFSRVRPSSGTQSLTELSSSQGIRFKPLYIFIENSIKDLQK